MVGLRGLRIVADEREKKSGIPGLLQSAGLDVEIKTLLVGDYVVGPEVVVERKSIKDLMSSVFDGRLFDQCGRLRDNFEHPVILMEGDVDEIVDIAENPMVFYGAVSAVALDHKIPIIPTPSASHTAKLLASMCSRQDGRTAGTDGPLVKRVKKSENLRQQQLSVLASLPGVGQKIATRLLDRFDTPRGALTSTTADLAGVEGMGIQRAKKIKRVMGSKRGRRDAANKTRKG